MLFSLRAPLRVPFKGVHEGSCRGQLVLGFVVGFGKIQVQNPILEALILTYTLLEFLVQNYSKKYTPKPYSNYKVKAPYTR